MKTEAAKAILTKEERSHRAHLTPIIACELVKYCNILRFEFTVQRHMRGRRKKKSPIIVS